MGLIIAIDVAVVAILIGIALTKGFEAALPFFAFIVTLVPNASVLPLPGLFLLTTQRVAIVALLALWLVVGHSSKREGRRHSTPLKVLILLNIVWSLISTANSVVTTTSLKVVLSGIFDFYLIFYIFMRTISTVKALHKVLGGFIAGLVGCCIFGWLQRYTSFDVIKLFPTVTSRFSGYNLLADDRIGSTFPHPILFAAALTLGIVWALYLLSLEKKRSRRIYLWVALILMFWNDYNTLSRGPWLGLSLSLLLLLFFSTGKVRKQLLVLTLLTVSVLIIRPGVWDTLKNTYFETLDSDTARGGSYQYRYDLMGVGRQALAKDFRRALWGFGPESFYFLGLEGEDSTTGKIIKFESCDSSIVETMVDTGYVGLLLFAGLFIQPILFLWREFVRLSPPENQLCLVFAVNLVAFCFMMISVELYAWGQQTYMLWILLALSLAYPRLLRRESTAEWKQRSAKQKLSARLVEVSAR